MVKVIVDDEGAEPNALGHTGNGVQQAERRQGATEVIEAAKDVEAGRFGVASLLLQRTDVLTAAGLISESKGCHASIVETKPRTGTRRRPRRSPRDVHGQPT